MNRLTKYLGVMIAFIFIFSLLGCSLASVTSQNTDSELNQKVEEDETEVNSVIVSKTSEVKGSSPNENDVVINKVDLSPETKNEQTSTEPEVETNQEVSPSKKEAEKAETAETVSETNNKKIVQTTTSKERTKKETNANPIKVTTEPTKQTEPIPTVSITIIGPKDFGVILPKTKVNFNDGDTVLNVLLKAAKKKNIEVEHRGSGAMAYIEGIDNIYEFDYGPKSGWNFKLNGNTISKSSGIINVKKDDVIEWVYSEDFTEGNE
jgi:hypothetical protein